ncbi:hypothetical protein [Bizionia sp.]|uniref:hypothetical protein n=1 Tax=Bizionia sp. TaxID=1954480 RepID=UPI003A8F9F8C
MILTNQLYFKKWKGKTIVWFKASNTYVIFEQFTAQLIQKLHTETPIDQIVKDCARQLKIPQKIAALFLIDLQKMLQNQTEKTVKDSNANFNKEALPNHFHSRKYYQFYKTTICIYYETNSIDLLIHPKFAHLELETNPKSALVYHLYQKNKQFVFAKNNRIIGSWSKIESHFFQGKVFMHILMDMYQKTERDWLAVFHASAIQDKKEAILLLGDSGNGKSTSLALLNAAGFESVADDFVPIDSKKKIHVYPAAISIKKTSYNTLAPLYPQLKKAQEYQLSNRSKTVRYLFPKNINYKKKYPCKALVFIKYDTKVDLELKVLSKTEALEQLVPDSWISSQKTNVAIFLDWFLAVPAYQLCYSNNLKMLNTITKIFNDEL